MQRDHTSAGVQFSPTVAIATAQRKTKDVTVERERASISLANKMTRFIFNCMSKMFNLPDTAGKLTT